MASLLAQPLTTNRELVSPNGTESNAEMFDNVTKSFTIFDIETNATYLTLLNRRTVVSIPNGPSALAVKEAAWGLARYAAISQVRELTENFLNSLVG